MEPRRRARHDPEAELPLLNALAAAIVALAALSVLWGIVDRIAYHHGVAVTPLYPFVR